MIILLLSKPRVNYRKKTIVSIFSRDFRIKLEIVSDEQDSGVVPHAALVDLTYTVIKALLNS